MRCEQDNGPDDRSPRTTNRAAQSCVGGNHPEPMSELLGRRLVAHDEERGWIKFEFEGRPEFLNPAGRVQGGLLTAMLDDTMGPVVLLKSGGALYPSSIDMTVSFLAAARPGALMCEADVVRLRKSVGFVQGHLTDGEGRVIARLPQA